MGLVLTADDPPEGLSVSQLRAERLAVALPVDHRLAHRTVLRLRELRDDPLVVQTGIYLEACAEAGFAARVAQHVTSLQGLLGFVAAGLGWAFVAQSLVTSLERAGVAFVSLRGTSARLPTALAWPEGNLSASARFVVDAARPIA